MGSKHTEAAVSTNDKPVSFLSVLSGAWRKITGAQAPGPRTSETGQAVPPDERRHSPRIPMKIPVRLQWEDKEGTVILETGTTNNVSAGGALVTLNQKIPNGAKLELTNMVTHETAPAKVAWTGNTVDDGVFTIGIEMENPNPKFWTGALS